MIPRQLPAMVRAEIQAVFGRWSGRVALVAALAIGILSVVALVYADQMADHLQANGTPAASMLVTDWQTTAAWALTARNFFVLPLFLVLGSAATISGELRDNTLRELLVRPVPRWSIVLAKILALWTLSLSTLVITATTSIAGGAALFARDLPMMPVLQGYAMTWVCDLGLITMAVMVAAFMTSVGGVVVSLALYLMADWLVRGALRLAGNFGVDWAPTVRDVLPGTALELWGDWDAGFATTKVLTLVALIVISGGVATVRVQRMDVP